MSHEITTQINTLTKEIEETKDDDSLLISLHERRAEWYTRTGEYENAFDDYFKAAELKDDGSLFLIEDEDYGWCMTSAFCIAILQKNINFLDYLLYSEYNDDQTSKNKIKEYLAKTYTTQEDWNDLFNKTKNAVRYIPEQFLTEPMCLSMLNRDDKVNTEWDSLLRYIPKEKITREMSEIAAKHSCYALKYMPDAFKTPELCLLSVQHKGYVLEHVPEDSKTAEICLAAVQNDGFALQYVPDNVKTKVLCDAALNGNAQCSYLAFSHIPDHFKTPEMCLEVVAKWGNALAHVPREYKTKEMCLAAVKQEGWALDEVPEELITLEMCVIACKDKGPFCLEYVPEHLVSEVETICGIKRVDQKPKPNTGTDDDIPF
ncbi:hypothetical protein AGMMS50293_26700 [Spirochaetia bacterium]|nr:hypothetical protein AGMMS50293_26700 [Spirochaetia bacterium]